jgi:predicted glycosyltransferase
MNILIEVRHPHHVHVFRHTYFDLIKRGHNVKVVAVDKEMSYPLLERFNIPFEKVGVNRKGLFNKLINILSSTRKLNKIAKGFRTDLLVGKASPTMAFTSFLRRKPYILFTDTENAKLLWFIIKPFVNTFVSPDCYEKDLGINHIIFNGYLELAYLHKSLYQPNQSILKDLDVQPNDKYVLIRFVSWNASHDIGQSGFGNEDKLKIVQSLSKHAKVFISSENELPDELKQYKLNIEPDKIFDVLKYASLYIGEGATMASECVVLGTPSIFVSSLETGYTNQQRKNDLLFQFNSSQGVLEKSIELISDNDSKENFKRKSQEAFKEYINVSNFITWLIENYPESVKTIKEDPDYQYTFK